MDGKSVSMKSVKSESATKKDKFYLAKFAYSSLFNGEIKCENMRPSLLYKRLEKNNFVWNDKQKIWENLWQ